MPPEKPEVYFQFRFVRGGEASGLGVGRGLAQESGLKLGQQELPYDLITDTFFRERRLVLAVKGAGLDEKLAKNLQDGVLVLEIYKWSAELLKQFIDQRLSLRRADENRRRMAGDGRPEAFRSEVCPQCRATIDLSEKPKTSFLFCPFCDSLWRSQGGVWTLSPAVKGARMGACDECSFWGRIKGYTEFYFYFLLVVYGFSSKKRQLCDGCAARLFWKNLALNFCFVLGIPAALILKVRALAGRDADFKILARANALGRGGRTDQAAPLYDQLMSRWPDHPGILFNQALTRALGGDIQGAGEFCRRAEASCSNYQPAANLAEKLDGVARGGASGPTIQMTPQTMSDNPLTTHL